MKKVMVYRDTGTYAGYVKLSHSDVGETIGEVYNTTPDGRVGAVKFEPFNYTTDESLVFNQEGAQIGFVKLERYDDDRLGAEVYGLRAKGAEQDKLFYVQLSSDQDGKAEIRREEAWGEDIAVLQSEGATPEEVVLLGGGAALLLFTH